MGRPTGGETVVGREESRPLLDPWRPDAGTVAQRAHRRVV